MNYDTQQYAFGHGLATVPQLHLQQQHQQLQQHQLQQQQFHQQQQIFQHQYSQAVPTSNVYRFQFTGGGGPASNIFPQKDPNQLGMMGGIQSRLTPQHSLVSQPMIKQGVPSGMEGSSIQLVGGLDGMMYSQQKNSVKIIANTDGRMMQQQPENAVRMQQALVGVDVARNASFIEQSLNVQQAQQQGIRVAGHGGVFAYNRQHFPSWLQPQQISMSDVTQCSTGCQSTLPSFNHVWSQFQHQKQQLGVLHQQNVNQYQQPQQIQTQQQFTVPNFQPAPNIQRINMHTHQNPQQIAVPISLQTATHIAQERNCISQPSGHLLSPCISQPSGNLLSPSCTDKEILSSEREASSVESGISMSSQPNSSSCVQPPSSYLERLPTTTVTYTVSGPPIVTVTLDSLSLTHSESFPPGQFQGRQEACFKQHARSSVRGKSKTVKTPGSITSALFVDNFQRQAQPEWQISQNQRNSGLPKPLVHTSSTGSSLERSSSESSSFSSPPCIFTPPSGSDCMFSSELTHFPKAATESSPSGRTSVLSSSSSTSLSSSPAVPLSQSVSQYATTSTTTAATFASVVTAASSVASSVCTVTAAGVVFSCSSMAITTTSVVSTTPSPRESTSVTMVRSSPLVKSCSGCTSESLNQACSPAHRCATSQPDEGKDRTIKVPYSWQRKYENGVIVYLSPSGVALQSLDQICHYLLSDSTCKCGLECPVQLEKFFSFDPDVENQPWSASSSGENLGNLCNHRRGILALAAFHSSQSEAAVKPTDRVLWLGRKRERKKSIGTGERLIVAPLKRLKTSITNAVNKHVLSMGSGTPYSSPAVDEQSHLLNAEASSHCPSRGPPGSSPPAPSKTPGGCNNSGDCSDQPCSVDSVLPRRSDCQKASNAVGGNNKLLSESVHMQKPSDQARSKHDLHHHHQHLDGQAAEQENSVSQAFLSLGDNRVFHHGSGRELGMQNKYPLNVGTCSNEHSVQFPQHHHHNHHHHHQQSANAGVFFSQNHMFPNPPHASQQRNPGFHPPASWQSGFPDVPASVSSHSHHHPTRPYEVNFQHSNCSSPQSNNSSKPAVVSQAQVDCMKVKSKRPKSKKDKQKQINSIVDRSSPCPKVLSRSVKAAALPSTAASFFGNPMLFVEQQAAIIKGSIASCHILCSSPSPLQCELPEPAVAFPTLKNRDCGCIVTTSDTKCDHVKSGRNVVGIVGPSTLVVKEEDEDQKMGTDLDSNKSFSDTTENNDSAYLSQTGSDQERSDVLDGLDSCSDKKPASAGDYSFHSLEDQDKKPVPDIVSGSVMSRNVNPIVVRSSKSSPAAVMKPQQTHISGTTKTGSTVSKYQENKKISKAKPKVKTVSTKKDTLVRDVDLLKKSLSAGQNGTLAQQLASSNWSIPALQQVLAQYGGEGSDQLVAALQQIQFHTNTGVDFPASSLLSAAARAQHNQKQREQVTVTLSSGKTPVTQKAKVDVSSAAVLGSVSVSDAKAAAMSAAVCGTVINPVLSQQHHHHHQQQQQQQPQPSFQQVGPNTNLIGNMLQFQQLSSGGFAMNMLLPANGQGHMYTTDSLHSGNHAAFNMETDIKNGRGAVNSLMAQGILATVSQTADINSQIKLSVASVIPSSLGPSAGQCPTDSSTVLLNGFGPSMLMTAANPAVSVSVMTNATKSLAQVVPAIGINQTVFGTQQVAQQLMGSHPHGAQIINTGVAAPGPQMISTSPHGAQLISTAQGAQFINPAASNTHLLSSTPQTAHIMNTLSVQGLNNQLLITNPVQQVSPSNSLSQLSPAMAAQFLTQGHSQMSPSYLQKPAQNSVINSQNLFASVSFPALTITSDSVDVIAGSMVQANLMNNNIQKNSVCDSLDKLDISCSMSQIKDHASMASSAVYAAASQPVFVIPQPNANPVMSVLGSAQPLSATSGLSTDLNIQQAYLSQMFGQSAAVDQSVIQNLLATGFSPLAIQQMMNMVSLSGVQQQQQQQQQQQFQMLQLQQLMLQQLHNHGQNSIQGISLPLSHGTNRNQTTAIGAQAIMSAMMPPAGLQLNSVMDMTSLNPSLSPVAQGYQSQISPAAAPLQHISPALAVHPMTPVNSCATLNVVQSGSIQNLMQIPAKHLHPLQSQQLSSDQVIHTNQNPALNPPGTTLSSSSAHETATSQVPQLAPDSFKPTATVGSTTKPPQPSKPKPKSKSKKLENKKMVDPEAERNEEDIAATVQQILAQAVQQQKELSLAAKNQPPPPPKSKSKKSHYRTKASQATKDHDLGKLASISDDIGKPEGEALRKRKLIEASKQHPVVLEEACLSPQMDKPGLGEARLSHHHLILPHSLPIQQS